MPTKVGSLCSMTYSQSFLLFLAETCRTLSIGTSLSCIASHRIPHFFYQIGKCTPHVALDFSKNQSSIFTAWSCFQLSPQSKSLMPISSLFRFKLLCRITMQQEKRGLTRISRPSFTTIRPSCLLLVTSGVTYSITIERENPAWYCQAIGYKRKRVLWVRRPKEAAYLSTCLKNYIALARERHWMPSLWSMASGYGISRSRELTCDRGDHHCHSNEVLRKDRDVFDWAMNARTRCEMW